MTVSANLLTGYFAVVGAALLATALILAARRAWLCAWGVPAIGEILGYQIRMKAFRGQSDTYMPRVRFEDAAGQASEFQARTSADPTKLPPGSTVPIRFDPKRRERAVIMTPAQLLAAPLAVAILGAGLLIAAWRSAG